MTGTPLALLIIISAFTMNLTLQCALGIKGAAEAKSKTYVSSLIKLCIIFISVILVWFLFSGSIFSFISGFFVYVLVIPVGFIVYEGLEFLFFNYVLKTKADNECFISFPGGITAAVLFICLNMANNIYQTAVLAFGFTGGIFLVSIIILEIRKRAAFENVPVFIRGRPLVLIAMGMMSIVFSAGALLILRMIDAR